nr:hypothetical protein [Actinomycetota bacterium]
MDLVSTAQELYALAPQEFTASRNERAKAARDDGHRELAEAIKALRKPSSSAWVVNMLARHQPAELEQLVDLGAALREAQENLDGTELRELNRQRHELVAAVGRQARALAVDLGHRVSESVATEVEQTLRAALTDAGAGAAARSGLLTHALETTGLAPVEIGDAVAVPSAVPGPDETQGRTAKAARRRTKQAKRKPTAAERRRAEDAERSAAEADEELSRAEERLQEATSGRAKVTASLDDLRRRVRRMERHLADAERDAGAAEKDRDRAARRADDARRAAE